jgi:uncharacterized protein (TIGR02646 family)
MRENTAVIEAVERSLLKEQGHLCCYTGIRVDNGNYHVEHLKPQKCCIANEDIDYKNILVAYPRDGCAFGAHAKGDWHQPELMVSPLDPSCSGRFAYGISGEVSPANPSDLAAHTTIQRLRLNHQALAGMRRAAIEGLLARAPAMGTRKLERIAREYSQVTPGQPLAEFCFVIQQVADQLLQRARRERSARGSPSMQ